MIRSLIKLAVALIDAITLLVRLGCTVLRVAVRLGCLVLRGLEIGLRMLVKGAARECAAAGAKKPLHGETATAVVSMQARRVETALRGLGFPKDVVANAMVGLRPRAETERVEDLIAEGIRRCA